MTTDRELLELAAKAAVVIGNYQHWEDSHGNISFGIAPDGSPGRMWWNPLTDDGEALRLAVKLGMLVEVDYYDAMANGIAERLVFGMKPELVQAAARRAIVRAAAEIGRRIPS